jgi:hypothetical protein
MGEPAIKLSPTPPSLDYHCAKCKKPITNWSAVVRQDAKLVLTAKCHGEEAEYVVYLGMSGELFGDREGWTYVR